MQQEKMWICDISIEGISFEHPRRTFAKKKNLNFTTKNVICALRCTKCKESYIGITQAVNNRVSLQKSNIKFPDNRNIFPLKHIHKCNKVNFNIMPLYQTDDYSYFQIQLVDKLIPALNK